MNDLSLAEFRARLEPLTPEPLEASCVEALHTHYRLLLRWNARVSLVGPGTLAVAVEVHYAESLAVLPLLRETSGATLVDVGSGAGFPGFVLAVARPRLRVVLVEARERKWSFLKAALAEAGVATECLLGSVDRTMPPGFPSRMDVVTLRALKLSARAWQSLASRLSGNGRVLVWAGRDDPEFPSTFRIRRSVPLAGSQWKRILELERSDPSSQDAKD